MSATITCTLKHLSLIVDPPDYGVTMSQAISVRTTPTPEGSARKHALRHEDLLSSSFSMVQAIRYFIPFRPANVTGLALEMIRDRVS